MKSLTVLCVDDDSGIRELYDMVLGNFGYRVLLAEDAENALELFHSTSISIDAVLLDYQMPGMNGIELAAHLKGFNPDVPIIMISGSYPDLEHKPDAVDLALPKGLAIEKLLIELDILLSKARASQVEETGTSTRSMTSAGLSL